MRKTLKIIGIYLFLIILNQSCWPPDHSLISGIEFNGATLRKRDKERVNNQFNQTDVLKNDIVFIIRYNFDYVASINLGLSEKCYAFSKGLVIDNSLLENTYSLKFDHPFTYRNLTINANQNIFEIDEIKNEIEIYDCSGMYGVDKVFEFSKKFNSESVFTSDDYEVTFSCSTSDNKNFEKKIIVKIEN